MRLFPRISVFFLAAMYTFGSIVVPSASRGNPLSTVSLHPMYLYRENTGKAEKNFQWSQISSAQDEVITVNEQDATFVNHCDRTGKTHAWDFQQGRQTTIHVVRAGNILRISGILGGKPIETTETIDDRPWYQPLSFSLRSFFDSPETKISFWMIRSDNLKVVTMQAKKGESEEITVAGKKVRAQKVVLSREGLLAGFWQATFWFRQDDRIFVRYQGIHGPPGTSETVVQLLKEFQKR